MYCKTVKDTKGFNFVFGGVHYQDEEFSIEVTESQVMWWDYEIVVRGSNWNVSFMAGIWRDGDIETGDFMIVDCEDNSFEIPEDMQSLFSDPFEDEIDNILNHFNY